MKVKQLIEKLQAEDPEAEVHIAYGYGDHWRTTVAPKVQRVDETRVHHSDYHDMPAEIDEEDNRYDAAECVVVIR